MKNNDSHNRIIFLNNMCYRNTLYTLEVLHYVRCVVHCACCALSSVHAVQSVRSVSRTVCLEHCAVFVVHCTNVL
jgi:hypothetical protein